MSHSYSAEELQRAFDQSFAQPARGSETQTERLVLCRHGEMRFAVNSKEIASLVAQAQITPLPSRDPGLLGIFALRSKLIPVWKLSLFLSSSEQANSTFSTVMVCRSPEPLAFAFDGLIGMVNAQADSIQAAADNTLSHISQYLIHEENRIPILSLVTAYHSVGQRIRHVE
jgi:chemotaxis signal transduction protein